MARIVTKDSLTYENAFRPKYADTQITPKNVFLDPAWQAAGRPADFYVGSPMIRTVNGVLPAAAVHAGVTGAALNQEFVGFSAYALIPSVGIDDINGAPKGVDANGRQVEGAELAVWRGDISGTVEIDAPLWAGGAVPTKTAAPQYVTYNDEGKYCLTGTTGAATFIVGTIEDVIGNYTVRIETGKTPTTSA